MRFRSEFVSSRECDTAARVGRVETPHGTVETPAFFPVGTRGSVRTLDNRDLLECGTQGILANTYHLMLRPGVEVVSHLGGLHEFMAWEGPILTDSGGFQAMSLGGHANEDGIVFKSVYDGSEQKLTAESVILLQEELGPDFAVALDLCIALPAPRGAVEDAMRRSLEWSERGRNLHSRSDQALVGVVQGGTDLELRQESVTRMRSLEFDVYAIGGLAVGESLDEMLRTLDVVAPCLPDDRIRYLMGVGDPIGIVEAISRGVDLFDCVLPTRLARHGTALTSSGKINLKSASYSRSEIPIDELCDCRTCNSYSLGYLRHLLCVGEELGKRAISIHNLRYLLGLLTDARIAIEAGSFTAFRDSIWKIWGSTKRDISADELDFERAICSETG